MPPLRRPSAEETLTLPARQARVAADCDVLVVGGGPAGIGAALGAAEAGAEVILAERYGFLGGLASAALVMPFASNATADLAPTRAGATSFFPTDHGHGEPVIAGVFSRFVERLVAEKGAIPPSRLTGYSTPFDPEVLKLVAMDLLDEAGVQVLLHAFATGTLGDGRPEAVVFETKSGPIVVRAGCVVDCTGDGDVAAAAGAPYEIGRPEDGFTQPMTLYFRLIGFDLSAFSAYVDEHPGQWFGVFGLWELIKEAHEAGEFTPAREDILMFGTPHHDEVAVNSTRVPEVLGIDVFDLSYAEWEGHRQVRAIERFMRERVPGFERARNVQSGTQIGVRETRRILGECVLTKEDVLGARRFPDVVARNAYPLDIHNPRGRGTLLRRLPPGEAYDIPLRCLIPREPDGLLVAGRCVSTTHEALSSVRVMPSCMATGHAAGVCAALSANSGVAPRSVPVAEVQSELRRQGADLGSA